MWEFISRHTGWVEKRQKKGKDGCTLLCFILSLGEKKGQRQQSGAEQEATEQLVETDKREEQEGGGDSIVCVCLH